MMCEWLLTNCTKMRVDICTWRTIIGHFHLFSKSSRTRNKKLLGISPLTLLCTTWAIVALNLFACRQMNEVNGACSPAHHKTNDTRITPQLVNVTLGDKPQCSKTTLTTILMGLSILTLSLDMVDLGSLGVTQQTQTHTESNHLTHPTWTISY